MDIFWRNLTYSSRVKQILKFEEKQSKKQFFYMIKVWTNNETLILDFSCSFQSWLLENNLCLSFYKWLQQFWVFFIIWFLCLFFSHKSDFIVRNIKSHIFQLNVFICNGFGFWVFFSTYTFVHTYKYLQ